MFSPVPSTSDLGDAFGLGGFVRAAAGGPTQLGETDCRRALFSYPVARAPVAPLVNRHLVGVVSLSHSVL